MKKTTALLVSASLALGGISTAAQADWGYRHGYRPPPPPQVWRHQEHRHGGDWVGPAAIIALTGLAIGAAAYSQAAPAPVTVYRAPPPPIPVQVRPASGYWYFCGSSGQYYPYTQACPEGWQQVMPGR